MVISKISRGIDLARFVKNWPALVFSILGRQRKLIEMELRSGLRFRIRGGHSSDHNIFREVFIEQIYTPGNLQLNGGTVVDVGAHIGFFSVMAAQTAKRVIAVEPTEYNGSLFEENIKSNGLKNVTLVRKALGRAAGKRKMYVNKVAYHTGLHSFYKDIAADGASGQVEEIEMETIKIDQLFEENKIRSCDFLKMDCEGAEYDILLNASDQTLKKINKIAISVHNVNGYTGKTLQGFLEKKGFDVWFAPGGHPLYAKNRLQYATD